MIRSRLWGARVPPPRVGPDSATAARARTLRLLVSRLRANAPGSQSQINVNSWVRLSDAAPNDQTDRRDDVAGKRRRSALYRPVGASTHLIAPLAQRGVRLGRPGSIAPRTVGPQCCRGERFGQVGHGVGVECSLDRVPVGVRGQDDHRRSARRRSRLPPAGQRSSVPIEGTPAGRSRVVCLALRHRPPPGPAVDGQHCPAVAGGAGSPASCKIRGGSPDVVDNK